ncbi:MAG: TetR/AcrR family transcriptional regulator [Pseudomonadota bacterium]|nr:TetR/AcrR family transcriptional regulator [Pseudomonadota bacterium]
MRYEKGRKDASRQKIMEVASERFRRDGIAATGLAAIMSDAGMTNGAFYPHFQSKADLVRETVAAATDANAARLGTLIAEGGLESAIATYLSPGHRDDPGQGCPLAALLPELARQPLEARRVYADNFIAMVGALASALPPETPDREDVALGLYATLIGSIQLARAVEGTDLSDRILAAGANAARTLAHRGLEVPAD